MNTTRPSRALLATAALLAFLAGCGGDTILATVDDADAGTGDEGTGDAPWDFGPDFLPDIAWFDDAGDRGEFHRDIVEDAGPPDPWVPEAWDVPFEYLDTATDTVPDAAACGNGVVDPGEECDDANTNDNDECTNHCFFPRCGDGTVWHALEDCDPPGLTRPCTTGCGTTGGERCERYCRWTGVCTDPLEVCGNGVDDDCDGVTDVIIGQADGVVVSDQPINADLGRGPDIVWNGSELAALWWPAWGGGLMSRLDPWGDRIDWDVEFIPLGVEWLAGFFWTGSSLATVLGGDGGRLLLFRATDRAGAELAPPAALCAGACSGAFAASSGAAVGVVRYHDTPVEVLRPQYHFRTVSADGAVVSPDLLVGDYENVGPDCIAWTGAEYAVLAREWAADWTLLGFWLEFLAPDGRVARTVPADFGIDDDLVNVQSECVWTTAGLAVVMEDSAGDGGPAVAVLNADGTLLHSEPLGTPPDSAFGFRLVWTGAELGIVWGERDGDLQFTRLNGDGTRRFSGVRLTRSPPDGGNPALAWAGDAYAVVYNASDGIEDATYFLSFSLCP